MSVTAYDLSRFSGQNDSEPGPIRTADYQKRDRRKKVYRGRIAVCLICLFAVMSLTVYNNMLLTEARAMAVSRMDELTRLESEYSYLNWQLENMISLRNAADYAENELGLIKVSASQIEYINLHSDNQIVEGEAVKDSGGFFKRMWNAFASLFEL